MEPKPPSSQDDPPPPSAPTTLDQSHDALSDSLNRLTLANAAATPLPASPSLLSPRDGPPVRLPAANSHHQTPRRTPSSNSLRDERRKSIPALQKRASAASLRSAQSNGPTSPLASPRHSSANFAGSSTSTASPAMFPQRLAPEHTGPTAASIAAEHFQREVDLHQAVDLRSKTVVVVHDACYGHRFSRPRAKRADLASIVERPERMRACVLGVSAAYVRLGGRHAGERFAPHPDLDLHGLPTPFQIRKTARFLTLSDPAVTNVHGTQWMSDLKSMCDVAESRLALTGKELVRPQTQGNDGLEISSRPTLHSGDLYLCSESLNALQGALGGVCDGVDAVLGPGPTSRAFVCIRPPGHHCSADFPSGFCWINNVHVGISYGAMYHGLTHAAILDFDLHHGDGSQEITWAHNYKASTAPRNVAPFKKTAIGYYSLHDINSYPCEGGEPDKVRNASVCIDGAHGQSIWNVHLETWETEAEFWKLYRTKYATLINKARAFLRTHTKRLAETPGGPPPKAAIFISAGFDASEWESTGMQRHKVNVPTEFYARFTADVVRMSQEEGLGVNGRVISVLEGGYSDRALTSGVLSHLAGLGDTITQESTDSRLASEMTGRLGISTTPPKDTLKQISGEYDSEWWSPAFLSELEALMAPQPKEKSAPTYFAPTRSFSAKVVTPNRDRRSTGSGSHPGSDPSLPPLPEVGWATATHELSKALIPEHRQTMSYRPEELNAEASRQRRDRQVALDGGVNRFAPVPEPPTPLEDKRQLRVRKAKSPTPYSPRPATPRQQAMRKNRRTTIDVNDFPDASGETSPSVDANRRKSTTAAAVDMGELQNTAPTEKSTTSASPRKTSGGSRPGTPRRSASPRKAPPVPKVPAVFRPSRLADEDTPDDIDSLSAGVRKIKLVMPSPEEQAARERKAAEDRKSTSRAPSSSKNPKSPRSPRKSSGGTKAPRSKPVGPSSLTPSSSPPPLPTPTVEIPLDSLVKQETKSVSSSGTPFASSPVLPTAGMSDTSAPAPADPSQWTAPQLSTAFATNASPPLTPDAIQNSVPTQQQQQQQQSKRIFSPTGSTTQTKQGLPVFTSSSPIPFAAPANPDQEQAQQEQVPQNTTTSGQQASANPNYSGSYPYHS